MDTLMCIGLLLALTVLVVLVEGLPLLLIRGFDRFVGWLVDVRGKAGPSAGYDDCPKFPS